MAESCFTEELLMQILLKKYGTAQRQLDTRTRVNGKKLAGNLNEYMSNLRGCPSRFKSVTVRLLV